MTFADEQAVWASTLISGLVRSGLKLFVISPGSRSTPLLLALTHCPEAQIIPILDERSAAFFALGHAKATGDPACLICTSGSAFAHYFPAVIEAAHSFTPLVILSADRPPELRANAAPQSVNQIALFGSYARAFFDLGTPEGNPTALRGVARKAAQAVYATLHPEPGPVHINAAFREPLEPEGAFDSLAPGAAVVVPEILSAQASSLNEHTAQALTSLILSTRRGVIVAGPAAVSQRTHREAIEELAVRTGYPLLAEATSQLRFSGPVPRFRSDAFDVFLRNDAIRASLRPEVVLQIGAPPTSKSLSRMLGETGIQRAVIAEHGWNDPQNNASLFLHADVGVICDHLNRVLSKPRGTSSWTEAWFRADEAARATVDAALQAYEGPLSEAATAHSVVNHLAVNDTLVVSNSLPVRDLDRFCWSGAEHIRVISQRGASGIDGALSLALGAAWSATARTTLFIGDSAFLHDVGALKTAAASRSRLRIVVVNNDGGRIFEHLPLARRQEYTRVREDWFVMPHGLNISEIVGAFGVAASRAFTTGQLRDALDAAEEREGVALVEAVVDPAASKNHYELLDRAAQAALESLSPEKN